MKQIAQDLRKGTTFLLDVPAPSCRSNGLVVATHRTLVSSGTERMLVNFGKGSWLQKARSQPDKVKEVINKIQTDGLFATYQAVSNKLDQLIPLGYCNVGRAVDVGQDVAGISKGDRVASNGPHAEIVGVPMNLCARVPDNVDDDTAAFTVLSSVAMQSIRLVEPTIGERVVVMGLGLVGLIAVQILRANGCAVLGIDFNESRLKLAESYGAATINAGQGVDVIQQAISWSAGRGVDAVIVATATDDNGPIHNAAQMCRQRGRVVLVGVAGMQLQRSDFFDKEISFQVSCSYGPGRYDPVYEEQGRDYPFGYVRWTEQRNFEAVLQLMSEGKIDVSALISHRFPIADGLEAYDLLSSKQPSLGILLEYDADSDKLPERVVRYASRDKQATAGGIRVGVVGAGAYATATLLPALSQTGAQLKTIASQGGTSAAIAARRFGFDTAASDAADVFSDSAIDLAMILTRHNSHAKFSIEALNQGKHVFVEKPAAINAQQLNDLEAAVNENPDLHFMVGFNRRFAPLAKELKLALRGRMDPINLVYTVNAGAIPRDHWTQDANVGGGRIIGEGCHFIDFARFIVGSPIIQTHGLAIGSGSSTTRPDDNVTIHLAFEDGSSAVVHYFANGSKRFPKERVEVFSEGRIAMLSNYQRLQWYGWPNQKTRKLMRQDKGQANMLNEFVEALRSGGQPLISWAEIAETTRSTLEAVAMVRDHLGS